MADQFVSYLRVSTSAQGERGLGIDAQRSDVASFIARRGGTLLGEFVEVETGKGQNALSKRPKLSQALALCKKTGAVLVIAKLDRLSRNVAFIATLMEGKTRFIACDMPDACELTVHIMASFAQSEARRISQRTRDALQQAKLRGTKLGIKGPQNLKPSYERFSREADERAVKLRNVIRDMQSRGLTIAAMVAEINALGIPTAQGGQFGRTQLNRVIARIAKLDAQPEPMKQAA